MANRFAKFAVAPTLLDGVITTPAAPIPQDKQRMMMAAVTPTRQVPAGFTMKVFISEIQPVTKKGDKAVSQPISGVVIHVGELVQKGAVAILDGPEKTKVVPATIDSAARTITPNVYVRKSGAGFDTKSHVFEFTPEQRAKYTLAEGKRVYPSISYEVWSKLVPIPTPGMIVTLSNVTYTCGTRMEQTAEPHDGHAFFLNAGGVSVHSSGSMRVEDLAPVAFPLAEQRVPPVLELLKGYLPGDPNDLAPILISCCNVPPTEQDERFGCGTILPRGITFEPDNTVRGIFAEVRGYPQTYKSSGDTPTIRAKYTSINLLQFVDLPDGGKAQELYTIPQIDLFPEQMTGAGPTTTALLDAFLMQHQVPFYLLYKPDIELMRQLPTNGNCDTRRALYPHGALAGKTFAPFRVTFRLGEYCETHGIPVTQKFANARFDRYNVKKAFPSLDEAITKLSQDRNGKIRPVDRPYADVDTPSQIVLIDECGTVPMDADWGIYALNIDDYKNQPARRPHEDASNVPRIDMTPEEGDAFVIKELGIPSEDKVNTAALWLRKDGLPRYIFYGVRKLTERELASRSPAAPKSLKREADAMDPDAVKEEEKDAGAEPPPAKKAIVEPEPELFDEESQQAQF